jgi:hypothetical protein
LIQIAVDAEKQKAVDWVKDNSYDATVWGYDSDGLLLDQMKIYVGGFGLVPQIAIIDLDGNVRYADLEIIYAPFIISIIEELL